MKFIQKTIFLSLLWLGLLTAASAQTEKIKQLESDIQSTSGITRASLLLELSDAYMYSGDYKNAQKAADQAESLANKLNRADIQANALNREGKAMLLGGKRRSDRKFEQSLKVLRAAGSTDKALALDNLNNLRILAQQSGNEKEIIALDAQISRLKSGGKVADDPLDSRQDFQQALTSAQRRLIDDQKQFKNNESRLLAESLALQTQLQKQQSEIEQMSEEQMKMAMLVMQQRVLLDSVSFSRGMDSLAVSNANLALRESESNRKFNYAIMGVLLLLAGGTSFSFLRARQNAKILSVKNEIIREEQQRSENLLLNILPSLVAEELKKKGKTKARYFEDVSVLFADFVGFSGISEKLSPQQLVSELDTCFQKFDDIMAKYDLEKIKTIGDAYMCAGGVPDGGGACVIDMVSAAKEMQAWLAEWNQGREKLGQPRFDARIGIHCGPVVAGVVGSKKFAFDIWGDTVNIAARIEQAGEGGRINISGAMHEAIKDQVACQYRGKIAAKNKGDIDMYFVES